MLHLDLTIDEFQSVQDIVMVSQAYQTSVTVPLFTLPKQQHLKNLKYQIKNIEDKHLEF